MDPQRLLEQFLGSGGTSPLGGQNSPSQGDAGPWDKLRDTAGTLTSGPMGGFGGGMAAGGLLGLLVGSKKVRKMAGGVVGYGGAAVLGALAHRAYQNWQEGKAASQAPIATQTDVTQAAQSLSAPGADGKPFTLGLVLTMIAAAKADGHMGPEEQALIFEKMGALTLDAESKAFIFDALARPIPLSEIVSFAKGPEQAAEIYLAARLAIDPDHPAETAYLEALAHRLQLPPDLIAHIEHQTIALPAPGGPAPASNS